MKRAWCGPWGWLENGYSCKPVPGAETLHYTAGSSAWLKCCFTSTETVGLLGTGAQDVHLDFHTAPELLSSADDDDVELNVLGCRVDILGTHCDQCVCMV